MKKSSVNTFTEGLVCDLDPINVPNNVLTDCLNGTIITYDDNEYSLQNDKGNYPLKDCKLRENFIPVGIKEHNGILYIASLNPITGEEEIGSYPSPKLYDGGTVNGNINIEYVIDKAFEELKVSELDYSELESRCKSWYYADPKLKLNVGDKFWFEEESSSTNFEKIEKYIIDENSIPHLISNDLMNKSLEYVSPISGTIMLKNKIFEIANSSAETNTFSCWVNDNNSSEISNPEYKIVTNDNLTGTACIIYKGNGTLMSIQNPSSSNLSAVTSEYDNYNSFAMQFYLQDDCYYIKVNDYYLQYDSESSTGLSFTLSKSQAVCWIINISNNAAKIRPVLKPQYSISYHTGSIRCDGANAGTINLIRVEESDGLINNISSLFSFTHKIYIDDNDTLQWLTNDYLKYKVNLKVNDLIIYSNTFAGNSLISDSKTVGEYEIAIESRHATNLEWYGNNKIISKYFVTVIKNIDSNDQISAEIIPIVSISDTKNIIMSQFTKPLNNNVSEYTSTTWTIGEEYYRFYNYPSGNEYKTQYIELDVKGPIEASDDFSLNYNICEYNSSNCILSGQFTPGIGKTILEIDYNDSFVKEDAYVVEYSIMLAGTSVKSVKKKLITSELFNYDEFLEYSDYTNIDDNLWMSKYESTIKGGNVKMSVQDNRTDLSKSLYTYITGKSDYVNRNIPYPNFIEESDYNTYSRFSEARLSGYLYDTTILVEDPKYLTGPLWRITKNPYECTDLLGKTHITSNSSINMQIPVGSGQYVNFNSSNKSVCGRILSTEEIIPPTITYEWKGIYKWHNNSNQDYKLEIYKNSKLLKTFDVSPKTPAVTTDITEEMPSFSEDIVNIRLIISGQSGEGTWTRVYAKYNEDVHHGWQQEEIVINNVCKSSKEWFVKIPETSGFYVKINAEKNEKYTNGYWCSFSPGQMLYFNYPKVNVSTEILVESKIGSTKKTFKWEKTVSDSNIYINNEKLVSSEIDNINIKGTNDKSTFTTITNTYINPYPGEYVKGIVNSELKSYTPITNLSTNYRNNDVVEITNKAYNNNWVKCSGYIEGAGIRPSSPIIGENILIAYFGSTNGGWL